MLLPYVLVTYGALVGLVGLVITVHDLQLPPDERDPLFETACDVLLIGVWSRVSSATPSVSRRRT